MKNLNDLVLNERCTEVRALAEKLPFYLREQRIADLDETIGLIIDTAIKAGYRLNDLRYANNPY